MFHLVLTQARGSARQAGIRVSRESEWVRIAIELGPDSTPPPEIEKRWLSRMAIRHGGRVELDGGAISLLLPADASSDQNEVARLRNELAQAQEQGEAYARELAQAFSSVVSAQGADAVAPSTEERGEASFRLLIGVATGVAAVVRHTTQKLKGELGQERGSALSQALQRHLEPLFTLSGILERIRQTPLGEPEVELELAAIVRRATERNRALAQRRGVGFELNLSPDVLIHSRPAALELLVDNLIEQAVRAGPKGSTIRVSINPSEGTLEVEDYGAAVPPREATALMDYQVNPASSGRPPGIQLLVARVTAGYLGSPLALSTGENGATAFRWGYSRFRP
jgi:signal transduction histidine kinase